MGAVAFSSVACFVQWDTPTDFRYLVELESLSLLGCFFYLHTMHRMYDDVSVRVSWLSSQVYDQSNVVEVITIHYKYRGSAMSSAKSGEGPNE